MSGQPWGRTGRVRLGEHLDGTFPVSVEDPVVGWVCPPEIHADGWHGHSLGGNGSVRDRLPTLDAAVMWVLHRTQPKVWRAERRRVVYVRKARKGWLKGAWRVAIGPAIARDEDLATVGWSYNHKLALDYAIDYAATLR